MKIKKYILIFVCFNLLQLCAPIPTAFAGGNFLINGVSTSGAINSTYSMTAGNVYSFDFTGSTWATAKIKLWGAGGGTASSVGGAGGYVEGILDISTYKTFTIVVGGAGLSTYTGTTVTTPGGTGYYTTGGFNGGGRGVSNRNLGTDTGGGGGATDLRLNYTTVTAYATANRILVAAGGGGGTANGGSSGGAGGYPNGSAGSGYGGADGGTQSAGGSLNGSFGQGGENINNTGWNGGGGGGWYGGGAQKTQHGGGAGGSSYYDSTKITSFAHGTGSSATTGGSAQLILLTEGVSTSSFNSLSLSGGGTTATYRSTTQINANVTVASRITFKAGNIVIPGCKNKLATGSGSSFSVTCSWKPSKRGKVVITATATPTGAGISGATATPVSVVVGNRSGNR